MSYLTFKEWLAEKFPDIGGETWNNNSSIDFNFGMKSKKPKIQTDKSISKIDPDKLFFGSSKKQNTKLDIE